MDADEEMRWVLLVVSVFLATKQGTTQSNVLSVKDHTFLPFKALSSKQGTNY